MSRNPDLARTVSKLSWGLLDTVTELLLFHISLGAAALTVHGRNASTAWKMLSKANSIHSQLTKSFKPSQLKGALDYLKKKGLTKAIKDKQYELIITKVGLEQLNSKLPVYKSSRPWDKRIYVVDYDIAESDRITRDKLRDYLRQIKCAPLHKSTYLSVYNPKGLLKTWATEYMRSGNILISDLGSDGTLGDQPLNELIAHTFALADINNEYDTFLHNPSRDPIEVAFQYKGILSQDPQLPFELLPDWWLGDKAWNKYKSICHK